MGRDSLSEISYLVPAFYVVQSIKRHPFYSEKNFDITVSQIDFSAIQTLETSLSTSPPQVPRFEERLPPFIDPLDCVRERDAHINRLISFRKFKLHIFIGFGAWQIVSVFVPVTFLIYPKGFEKSVVRSFVESSVRMLFIMHLTTSKDLLPPISRNHPFSGPWKLVLSRYSISGFYVLGSSTIVSFLVGNHKLGKALLVPTGLCWASSNLALRVRIFYLSCVSGWFFEKPWVQNIPSVVGFALGCWFCHLSQIYMEAV